MAVATENRSSFKQEGETRRYDLAADPTTIFKGTLVNRDAAGNAIPAADTATLELYGVATEEVATVSGDVAGDKTVKVYTRGFFLFEQTTIVQLNVGAGAFVLDDQTVGLAGQATNDIYVGRIVDVPTSTTVVVSLFSRES